MRRLSLEIVPVLVVLAASPHGRDAALSELLHVSRCFNIGVNDRYKRQSRSRLFFDEDNKNEGVGNAR